jgi:hypothetical protein
MSRDGRIVHLVFSGDDHFALRRARLTVAAPAGGGEPPGPARR